jgi:acylphosphatase
VEAVFSGDPGAVAEMIERCRKGPRSAAVTDIDVQDMESEVSAGFEIRPTS